MMSQKESTRSTKYTPFFENKQFESIISQWRQTTEQFFEGIDAEMCTPK